MLNIGYFYISTVINDLKKLMLKINIPKRSYYITAITQVYIFFKEKIKSK